MRFVRKKKKKKLKKKYFLKPSKSVNGTRHEFLIMMPIQIAIWWRESGRFLNEVRQ